MFEASALQSLSLNIINVDFVRVESWWRYTDVYSPFHRLYLVSAGEGFVYHHDREFNLHERVLHLIPAYTRHSCRCESFLDVHYVHFACELEGYFDFFSDIPTHYQVEAKEVHYSLFKRLLELNPNMSLEEPDPEKYDKKLHLHRAQNYVNEVSPSRFLESKGIIFQFLSRFLPATGMAELEKEHDDYHRIEGAIRYLQENINKPLTVSQLAGIVSFNEDYFSRIFTKVMGVRPIEYLHHRRVQRVKLLLLTTDLSLEQIARRTGFSSSRYLSRIFRKYIGSTPTEYRKAAHYG